MTIDKPLEKLPKHFEAEEKQLLSLGFNSWSLINELNYKDLSIIEKKARITKNNLSRIKGMASFICEIDLSQAEAALLLHAGVPSIYALAELTPPELVQRTGRLERQLIKGMKGSLDLQKASKWINSAKRAKLKLTHQTILDAF